MVLLYTADTMIEAYLFAAMQGIVRQGVNTLAPLMWADCYGRASLGSIIGISKAAQVTGFAVGPLILGIAFDASGSYQSTFIYFALVAVVAAFLVFTARRPRRPAGDPQVTASTAPATAFDN
jgi:cyanate permease